MTKALINKADDVTPIVFSKDGSRINYLSMGSGPPIVVIPGALSMAADYIQFGSALAEDFEVHIIERRGRGASSPQGADYCMTKECEDVRAVQEKTGARFLVGHSFGGLVALETALQNRTVRKLALYEPGVSINGSIPTGWMTAFEKKLADRKFLDAFVEFSLGAGPDRARNMPRWLMKLLLPFFLTSRERQRLPGLLAQTLREHKELARLDSASQRYGEIGAGVLLMYGGKSDLGWVNLAIEQLAAVLPCSRTECFPALNHFGINKRAPREVATAVCRYFLE